METIVFFICRTKLEKQDTPEYRQKERAAQRIASEIASGKGGRRAGSDNEEEDEEGNFSSVNRPQDARLVK